MAFKRADLAGLGIEPDKIQILIDWHMDTVKALQAKIDDSKDESDKLAKVTAELEKAKQSLKEANDKLEAAEKDDYKGKYESKNAELEKLKADIQTEKTVSAKKAVLKERLLKDGYSQEAARLIVNRSDFATKIEVDKENKPTNLDKIITDIQADGDFSSFTPKVSESHHNPANPPRNSGGNNNAMTRDEILAIKDTAARQEAIAANPEEFGLPANND